MLVLSRKIGESIVIDEHIELTVLSVDGEMIKLGIQAPKNVAIHRKEIFLAIKNENRDAAKSEISLEQLGGLGRIKAKNDEK